MTIIRLLVPAFAACNLLILFLFFMRQRRLMFPYILWVQGRWWSFVVELFGSKNRTYVLQKMAEIQFLHPNQISP